MTRTQAITSWLRSKSTGAHHRQFLVLELSLDQTMPILALICNHYASTYCLSNIFSSEDFTTVSSIVEPDINAYQSYLGKQTNVLIFDTRCGINLNAFYTFAGMVNKKGLIVLCIEPNSTIEQQKLLNNKQAHNYNHNHNGYGIKHSYGQQIECSYFLLFLKQKLQNPELARVTDNTLHLPSSAIGKTLAKYTIARNDVNNAHMNKTTTVLSLLQKTIVNNIIKTISQSTGISQRFIILGKRGRGKSTLLGAIAAQCELTNSGRQQSLKIPVISCAVNKKQLLMCNSVFKDLVLNEKILNRPHKTIHNIKFYPPDEIINNAPTNAIIIIDEMASIAPKLLNKIVNSFDHVIMTGTTNGYEGSGQGFLHRVLPTLNDSLVFSLTEPFRWYENDPVEYVLDSILSRDVSKIAINTFDGEDNNNKEQLNIEAIEYSLIDKQQLLDNKHLSSQIFELLVQAHYQTTPNDIVRIMDAPDCKIFIACKYPDSTANVLQLIAVAAVFIEGGELLSLLAPAISMGQRRVQGHLTAQTLSLNLLDPAICNLKFLRINRIAVKENYRHKGIASRLLAHIRNYALDQKIDYLSTSFGYTAELLTFWNANKFTLAKLGQRIDTASGTTSLLMLQPCLQKDQILLSLIKLKLHVDLDYYESVHPTIYEVYADIPIPKITNVDHLLSILYERVSAAYYKQDVGFNNIASILLACLLQTSQENYNEQQSLLAIFVQSYAKGLHKHQRKSLQTEFISSLFKLIRQ